MIYLLLLAAPLLRVSPLFMIALFVNAHLTRIHPLLFFLIVHVFLVCFVYCVEWYILIYLTLLLLLGPPTRDHTIEKREREANGVTCEGMSMMAMDFLPLFLVSFHENPLLEC